MIVYNLNDVSAYSGAGAVPDAGLSDGLSWARLGIVKATPAPAQARLPIPSVICAGLPRLGGCSGDFHPAHIWRQLLADNENTCVLTAGAKRHGNIFMLLYIQ